MSINYKAAGVDIHAGNEVVKRIKQSVESTFTKEVLTPIGGFGAMYDLKTIAEQYKHPVLVQSIDGVGTKAIVARMMGKFDTLGIDLVSATTNDIIVLGAKPLTLLDYIANDRLDPETVAQLVQGMVKACKENDICLVGGETAEMPGTYLPNEHDVVGVITGVVEKDKAILGKGIQSGDVILGLASSGLHTNGYSLARKLFFATGGFSVNTYLPELQSTLGEALLQPHLNYTRPILHLLQKGVDIKGMAHISGGGLLENIPRILPHDCLAEINKKAWERPALFSLLVQLGQLKDEEAYRTFNMGIGLIVIGGVALLSEVPALLKIFPEFSCFEIGRILPGERKVRLV